MKRTILIICGNRSMNYIFRTVLGDKYDLIAVTDVFEGMKQLRLRNDIGLVIVDTDFQQKECLELITFLKSSFLHRKQVFALSSQRGEAFALLNRTCGADLLIGKPFNPSELMEKMDNYFAVEAANEESGIF